jgi:RHS repeat-associated protein
MQSGGATTTYTFTYVGVTNALSKEVLTGSGATTKRYAYDVFGQRSTISEGSNRYSYLYDPHTSVSLLIDQANTVKESYGYSAYGGANAALTRTASGFNAKTNPYRYTGKRLDSGSGTYDMGARRYSAATGRFLQVDLYYSALDNLGLSEDPLTQNRYALAGANPINFVEVDGHFSIRVCSLIPKTKLTGCPSGTRITRLRSAVEWAEGVAEKHGGTARTLAIKFGPAVATIGCVVGTSGAGTVACLVVVGHVALLLKTTQTFVDPSVERGLGTFGTAIAHECAILWAATLEKGRTISRRSTLARRCARIAGVVSGVIENSDIRAPGGSGSSGPPAADAHERQRRASSGAGGGGGRVLAL